MRTAVPRTLRGRRARERARVDDRQPLDPESEPNEPPTAPLEPVDGDRLVRAGLVFYGLMAIAAVVWRTGFYQERIWLAEPLPAHPLGALAATAAGVAVGLAVVALSYVLTERTGWGNELARALAEPLAGLTVPSALLLAVASGLAEEMFFRGALQPRIGWAASSLLFGLIHFVPRRELLPWTGFAVAVGFLLGWLFDATGHLAAPVAAHMVVNGVNLPLLVRRYGGGASSPR
jgi:membrane protease YdiL (CAAX protease family)